LLARLNDNIAVKQGPPLATWCFGAERWYNVYHRIPKGGRGGAVATLARWHTTMQAFRDMASGQLAPDCHPSLMGPSGLISKAIEPSSRAQSQYEDDVMGSLSDEEHTSWSSYGSAHRGSGSLQEYSLLVAQYLKEHRLVLSHEIPTMALSSYQRMRVEGVPYGTLADPDWSLEQLLKSRALVALRKGDQFVYAVVVTYIELRLRTSPMECLLVYRAFSGNHEESRITCHRPTGFACVNTASSLAGNPSIARVGDIVGPVVAHQVYPEHPAVCSLQLLAARTS
jgi:hypothetical protein